MDLDFKRYSEVSTACYPKNSHLWGNFMLGFSIVPAVWEYSKLCSLSARRRHSILLLSPRWLSMPRPVRGLLDMALGIMSTLSVNVINIVRNFGCHSIVHHFCNCIARVYKQGGGTRLGGGIFIESLLLIVTWKVLCEVAVRIAKITLVPICTSDIKSQAGESTFPTPDRTLLGVRFLSIQFLGWYQNLTNGLV